MSEVSERYERLGDVFAAKIAAVPAERWDSPSPCDGWTARDIVSHVINTQGMFLGFIGRDAAPGPSVSDDPGGAWSAARANVQTSLDDPEVAATEFQGYTGPSTFEAAVNRFLCFDLVVHGWDLARATGLDETIDPEDLARVQAAADAFGEMLRSPQAFGPAVEPPPGANDQQKLIAFLGRQP
jgi:uncharacterized protein (TIGR03086 family)